MLCIRFINDQTFKYLKWKTINKLEHDCNVNVKYKNSSKKYLQHKEYQEKIVA